MSKIPFGPLGLVTYTRTYSRTKEDGTKETFPETVDRIVNACDTQLGMELSDDKADQLKDIMINMKGMVAGRFLWQLGSPTVDKLGMASLQNCAVTAVDDPIRPFTWAMDMLMLGCGVGFNIQREYVYEIPKVLKGATNRATRVDSNDADFIVPDSREGWVKLLGKVLKAYFYSGEKLTYSTKCIRGKGTPIKGFGGTAAGPEELCQGLDWICEILDKRIGKKVRPIDCLDIMNILGYIVVAGNVRRSAQLAVGDYDDIQFLKAKRWDLGPIPNWRAMSNNSVACRDTSELPKEFWAGYEGKGEPYGLINLNLSRATGRIGETQYPDLDVIGYNPCITGDTKILTKQGLKRIDGLIGTELDVWNGFEWSMVTPKITGENQQILEVSFSDGRVLKCTPYHKFHLQNTYKTSDVTVKEAKDLTIGDKLIKCEYPVVYEGKEQDIHMYTQGFYSADGVKNNNLIWLYEPKFEIERHLSLKSSSKEYETFSGVKRKGLIPKDQMLGKDFVPFEYDLKSRLDWLAGLFDGDGCELKEGGIQLSSVDHNFLSNVQALLTTCGVNSKIVDGMPEGKRLLPDQKGGLKEFHCKESKRICIGAVQTQKLISLGMGCARLKLDKSPNRDASRFTTITGIRELGVEPLVYCFNEPKRHLAVFDGVITGQCAEQSLHNFETCCLAEIYLPNIENKEELTEVAKRLYEVCKHSLAMTCHHPETQEIVNTNMRMGIGVTGYLQSTEEQKEWLSDVYERLREYDIAYSRVHGFPESIKITTVKPSGTLSLLAGVTSGCHPGYSRHFIRRIRIATSSPLVDLCRKKGYYVEPVRGFDGSDDPNTMVVEFPCSYPSHTVLAKDTSAIDQMEVVKRLQTEWSDNAVSCTVYYKKEELEDIKKWLNENYKVYTKSMSFLLHSDHGFAQAPFEEITEEHYLDLMSKVEPFESVDINEDDMELAECSGGHCPIK